FKKLLPELGIDQVIELLGLERSADKEIRYFSSGMKQRTKLALACCSDTSMLFLDEPTSNLDSQGVEWYHQLIQKFSKDRLIIVASNQAHEYSFCSKFLHILDYKNS